MKNKLVNTFKYLLFFIIFYYIFYFLMFYIKINNKPILKYLQKEMIWNRNLFEYTLKNYSDINKYDIQFFGSSHTYRTFDTKIFEKKGIN